MNTLTLRNYLETNSKYNKLKKRFDKNVKSGSFYEFSKKKQRSLIFRLRKLFEKLLRLKNMLKLATAGATMAFALTAGQANAQDYKTNKLFDGKFKTELNSQKGFESDLFIQMTGLDNPFGGENPFDGQIFNDADYANFVDIDNDGDLDVVSSVYNYTSNETSIIYYKNEGDNSLADLVIQTGIDDPFDGLIFDSPIYLSFVDIDNDSDFDVFINNQNANEIYYFKNTGTAELSSLEEQIGGDNPFDGVVPMDMDRLNFADIDNDGDLDVFIGIYNGYPFLYRNTGTVSAPVFESEDASGLFDNTNGWLESLVLSDLDDDGDLDAVINGDNYYENQGDNTLPAFVEQFDTDNPFDNIQQLGSDLITLVDMDGDSDLDLLFGNYNSISYYENTGTTSNAVFEDRNGGVGYTGPVNAPAFADIDNDGDFDVFAVSYDPNDSYLKVNFFKNVGTNLNPEFEQQFGSNNPMNDFPIDTYINYPEFVDIDGDGDMDLFLGTQEDYYGTDELVKYYKNTGTANAPAFELQTGADNPLSDLTEVYAFISFADIDDDGDFDLFQGSIDNSEYPGEILTFYRNTGTNLVPNFVAETSPFTFSGNPIIQIPDFVDIDDDGDLDFFSATADYDIYEWKIIHYLNNGTAEVPDFVEQTGTDNPLNFDSYVPIPVFVDIDSDSDPDCFVGTSGGNILYFRNKTFSNSIEDIKENSLKLYPNPTNGIIVFETENFTDEEVNIDITNITGRTISNYRLVDYNKIDLSNLKAGIYFVRISNSSVSEVSKIVVQ